MHSKSTGKHIFRDLFRNSTLTLSSRIANVVISYAFVLLVSRYYGASVLGSFAICLTLLELLAMTGNLGLDKGVPRFVAEYLAKEDPASAWSSYLRSKQLVVGTTFLLSILLFLLAVPLSVAFFDDAGPAVLIRVTAIGVIPLALSQLMAGFFRGVGAFAAFAFIRNLSVRFFALFFLLPFFAFDVSSGAPVYALLGGVLCTCLASQFLIRRFRREKNATDTPEFSKLLTVSLPMMIPSALTMFMAWVDILMIGIMCEPTEVGLYHVVMRLFSMATMVLAAVAAVTGPRLVAAWAKRDCVEMTSYMRTSTGLIFWGSLPFVVIFSFMPDFILNLFGPEFMPASATLVVMMALVFVNSFVGSVGTLLQMTGLEMLFQKISLGALLLKIVMNIILIPMFGILGAAIAFLVSVTLRNVIAACCVRRKLGIPGFYLPLWQIRKPV